MEYLCKTPGHTPRCYAWLAGYSSTTLDGRETNPVVFFILWTAVVAAGPGAPELLKNPGFDEGVYTDSQAGGNIVGTWPNNWGDNTVSSWDAHHMDHTHKSLIDWMLH